MKEFTLRLIIKSVTLSTHNQVERATHKAASSKSMIRDQISYEGTSGIVLKHSSEMALAFLTFPLSPRIAISVLFSRVNLNRVLIKFTTLE